MRPERWREVERLYHLALECDPATRTQFLAEASGADEKLLDEVRSLLTQEGSDSRLDRAVWEPGTRPKITNWPAGTPLGQYTIEAPLGAGGMGEVFRAHDTRLNRTVAIKISHQFFNGRFLREARAVAALNHPNIVQIYGIESAAGAEFIVMEFVEGRTLAHLLREHSLPFEQVTSCAVQIASALAAAHAAGIVHRDIKPANIIVNIVGGAAIVKILDFGLATREPGTSSGDSTHGSETQPGTVLGTPSYMSPEQVEGNPVDVRSDIFSTGAVLYEMFTGVRAFDGESTFSVLDRVVHHSPRGIRELRPDLPLAVEQVVSRCLQKDPARRYPAGGELLSELLLWSEPPPPRITRYARIGTLIALILAIAITAGGWLYYRNQKVLWTRNEALPKIQDLIAASDFVGAFALTRTAMRYAPDDPQLRQDWANVSVPLSMSSVPPGARVSIRPFSDANPGWEAIGQTPLDGVRVPFANVRVRIEKDGMEPLEFAAFTFLLQGQQIRLYPRGTIPAGMVPVPEQLWTGPVKFMPLPAFFIDKFEVTNRQFEEFIEGSGYHSEKFWRYPFIKDGRRIPWAQALTGFRDGTGREGPSAWELGGFPKGQEDYPVGGVSWFEAAAYCEFRGKSLPTMHHWQKAAGFGIHSDILLFSNFNRAGPMRVGVNTGITPSGAYDMAGNLREWVQNAAGDRRLILGGAYNDRSYTFHDLDAQDPFARLATSGIRCASFPGPVPAEALLPLARSERDYGAEKPVGNETFEIFRRMYSYDKTPLAAKTESVDDSNDAWRKETVSYAAAYGGERIPAYLFLPRNAKPPYQTVLWAPGGYAQFLRSSLTGASTDLFDFLLRTGRAVLYPVYKGTFERHVENVAGSNGYRETVIQVAKDAGRSVDYLETRSDIQIDRLAYFGVSEGATLGPVTLALDARLRTGVLVSGGLYGEKMAPEIDVLNFAPRFSVPVLMLGGRYDFVLPPVTLQQPMFRLLGTREQDKRFIQFDTGHVPPTRDVMRETLNWLDRYLGPVETGKVAARR
jgi:eukaryotic-like serine/threonine-protein kinase